MATPTKSNPSLALPHGHPVALAIGLLAAIVVGLLDATPASSLPFVSGTTAIANGDASVLGCGGFFQDHQAVAGGAFSTTRAGTSGMRSGCAAAGSVSAGGFASANLALGKLRASAFASGPKNPTFANPVWQSGSARSLIFDTIQVIGPPNTNLTFVDALVTVTADGTLSGDAWASLLLSLTTDAGGLLQSSDCATLSVSVASSLSLGCNTLTTNPSPTINAARVARVFLNDPFLRIDAQLDVRALDLGSADFSQTALLSLSLPTGFSFISSSGVFLVPEPSTLLLLSGSVLALAWLTRRRSSIAARLRHPGGDRGAPDGCAPGPLYDPGLLSDAGRGSLRGSR